MSGTYRVKDSINGRVLGTASIPFGNSVKTVSIDLREPIKVSALRSGTFIIEASGVSYSTPRDNTKTVPAFAFGIKDATIVDVMTGDLIIHKNYKSWVPTINLR